MNDAPHPPRKFEWWGRKIAEWISLIGSALLILAIAAYLVYSMFVASTPAVSTQTSIEWNKVVQKDGRYILPLKIRNRGRSILQNVTVQITYRSRDGQTRQATQTIDFLPGRSEQRVYFYFDQLPAQTGPGRLIAQTTGYQSQ